MSDLDDVPLWMFGIDENELRKQFAKYINYDKFGHDGRVSLKSKLRKLETELRGREEFYAQEEMISVGVGGYEYWVPRDKVDELPKEVAVASNSTNDGFFKDCVTIFKAWRNSR